MKIYISSLRATRRSSSLGRSPGIAAGLVSYAAGLSCGYGGGEESVFVDDAFLAERYGGSPPGDPEGTASVNVLGSLLELARLIRREEPAPFVILSPFEGILSPVRMRSFLSRCEAVADGNPVASATLVPANANPLWLKALPRRSYDETLVEIEWLDIRRKCPLTMGEKGAEQIGGRDICGSQYLPDLYQFDYALLGFPGSPDCRVADIHAHIHDPRQDDSLLLFYKLPVFHFHHGQVMEIVDALDARARQLLPMDHRSAVFSQNVKVRRVKA